MLANKSYFWHSFIVHALIFFALTISYYFSTPPFVVENSSQKNIIHAVVLGDTPKSHILPDKKPGLPTPIVEPKKINQEVVNIKPKNISSAADIALKLAEEKKLLDKKKQELVAKNLLADIQNLNNKKKIKQKDLQSKFAQTLQEESEKSLRQHLLDEEVRLQTKAKHESQGIINKYKALILQAIGEQWLVPETANKKLYCELMISLKENGEVLEVKLTKSSGDKALDSSARAAVIKASPLPVPKDAKEFESFRQFVLKVKPENILHRDG